MNSQEARHKEHAKYQRAYGFENYAMGPARMKDALTDLQGVKCRGDYLDVSCGRGEMLDHAAKMGFMVVQGTEIVPGLIDSNPLVQHAEVHALPFPDNSFQVVSLFDVIEHLLPGDDELACKELLRVASTHILLTANNKPSFNQAGDELHINRRPYEEWDALFATWFHGYRVTWLKQRQYVSEGWRIDL